MRRAATPPFELGDHHCEIDVEAETFFGYCDGVLSVTAGSLGACSFGLFHKHLLGQPETQVINLDEERRKRRG